METTTDIGLVILGAAGNRGKSAIEMLPKLSATERTKRIHLELVSVAEAGQESREDLASYAASRFGYTCPAVGTLVEAIPYALRWLACGQNRKLIVYDATPTAHHYLHLMTVLPHRERGHIFCFGEKPLFTKESQADFVAHHFAGQTFFCEFIETENSVFRVASDFIRSESFQIQRMSFWRASCMGVEIAAGDGRGGVEGGALLDKAPHDLSVSLGLLGPRAVQGWSVRQARPICSRCMKRPFVWARESSFLSRVLLSTTLARPRASLNIFPPTRWFLSASISCWQRTA